MTEPVLAIGICHNALWLSSTFARMHCGKCQMPKRILAFISFTTMCSELSLGPERIVAFNIPSTMRSGPQLLPQRIVDGFQAATTRCG